MLARKWLHHETVGIRVQAFPDCLLKVGIQRTTSALRKCIRFIFYIRRNRRGLQNGGEPKRKVMQLQQPRQYSTLRREESALSERFVPLLL